MQLNLTNSINKSELDTAIPFMQECWVNLDQNITSVQDANEK